MTREKVLELVGAHATLVALARPIIEEYYRGIHGDGSFPIVEGFTVTDVEYSFWEYPERQRGKIPLSWLWSDDWKRDAKALHDEYRKRQEAYNKMVDVLMDDEVPL